MGTLQGQSVRNCDIDKTRIAKEAQSSLDAIELPEIFPAMGPSVRSSASANHVYSSSEFRSFYRGFGVKHSATVSRHAEVGSL